jgi:hypothetical protein
MSFYDILIRNNSVLKSQGEEGLVFVFPFPACQVEGEWA